MPLQKEDIIIGAEYEFCDPEYPEYWGHRFRVTELKYDVACGVSTRDADRERFVAVGGTASHWPRQLKRVFASESDLLFN